MSDPRVVLLGATGHTGALTAAALARTGISLVLAARDAAAAATTAAATSRPPGARTEIAVVDATQPATIARLVAPGDVVISTVGPFGRLGRPAVEACIAAGARYLDPSGDAGFLRRVLAEDGPRAERTGAVLLPGFGFESVPGNVAAALAADAAGRRARSVEVVYVCDPRAASRGTRLTVAGALREPGHSLRDGAVRLAPVGARRVTLRLAGRRLHGLSVPTTEPLVLRRTHPWIQDVDAYLAGLGPAYPVLRGLGAATRAVDRWPAGARALDGGIGRYVDRSLRQAGRSRPPARTVHTVVAAVARDVDGHVVSRSVLAGADPYHLTAELLAWAAERCAGGASLTAGALGPLQAFDVADLLAALRRGGMVPLAPADAARSSVLPQTLVPALRPTSEENPHDRDHRAADALPHP